ncbi:MAG: MFS transporter [Aestuariivirga sp.]|uniref:MFS transporter n=1 Tax=Aestuariivirga sp. TaxID=2650926 RepID=UPI0025C408DC|nr:MFS transporter [Aestuariivirga sp.]MCA3560973.1 MFS transporter [Aestuariivirga sp.]
MPTDVTTTDFPLPRRAGAYTVASLFAVESFVRSLNSTVISLQAYDILGAAQKVSELSTVVSLSVLSATLLLPFLLGRMRRRWAYTLGIGMMMAASLALASHVLAGQALGMLLRNLGAAVLNITLQLYIMENIKRTELARSEPIRLSLSTASWTIGPALGVTLYVSFGPWGPQLVAIGAAAGLLILFWWLRLSDTAGALPAGNLEGFNPLVNVRRFLAQPRLRLAWLIAFGRSCFWTTFFIYGPLLLVEAGLDKRVGGYMISGSQILLFTAWFAGRFARSFGVRAVLAVAFTVCAVASLAAGLAGTASPYVAIACLLAGSVSASAIDGVGGIPFLRAVRHHERQKMAAVYRTYIDCSELIPAFIFAIALLWLPIGAVFVILSGWLAAVGWFTWRYVPKSL